MSIKGAAGAASYSRFGLSDDRRSAGWDGGGACWRGISGEAVMYFSDGRTEVDGVCQLSMESQGGLAGTHGGIDG